MRFRRCGGTICWRGSSVEPPGHDDNGRPRLVEEFVAALPGPAHRVLEYLAVEDPLSLADACRAGGRATPSPTPRRLVPSSIDGDRVRPAHPLFVDAVRDALGGPELRRLRTAAGESAGRLGARADVVDRLRLAVLALDSDSPQPVAELAAAAEEALRLGDLELSERLGRAARRARRRELAIRLTAGLCAGVAGPRPGGRRGARRPWTRRHCPRPS